MQPAFPGTRSSRIVQSRQNARVKELRAGFARSARTEHGLISIEGEHLLAEAIASRLRLATVFASLGAEHLLDRLDLPAGAEILTLSADIFSSAVATESPQGIAALVEPPGFMLADILGDLNSPAAKPPLILIAAGLQDPGNLGTLIRSAEAFAATGLITLPGTVSLWNQKTLRASSGSAFRLPIVAVGRDETDDLFATLAGRRISALAAVADEAQPASECNLTAPAAIILGNEGSGIPPEILRQADIRVTIPCPGPVESLNAAIAGSILLYEASRQREAGTR